MKTHQLSIALFLFLTSVALFVPGCKQNDEATAPTVSITAPADGASLVEGLPVEIDADAADADGTVSKVEFYADANLLRTDSLAPFFMVWTAAPAGNIALTVKAYDNEGHSATSAVVHVSVGVNTSIIGSWRITAATFNPPVDTGGGFVTDAYPQLFPDVCDQDDFFTFEAGGIFKDNEGAVKCDSLAPQFTQGTYSESGNTITVINGGDTTVFKNTVISTHLFTGSVTFDFGGSSTTEVEFELTRQ